MNSIYLKLFVDCLEKYQKLNDTEFGRLVRAALRYKATGAEPDDLGREALLWDGMRLDIDRDNESYKNTVSARSEAGKKGAAARWQRVRQDSKDSKCHLPYSKNGQDKDKDKDKDGGYSGRAGAQESPAAVVARAYLDRVNPMASQASLEELSAYVVTMGAECCLRAIDIALDEKRASWSYIRAILRDKAQRGVRCIADWDALEAKREEAKQNGSGNAQSAGKAADGSFHGFRAKSSLDDAD